MSYWYIAHENELLIDLDSYIRPTRSGEPWGEVFFRRRLRSAIKSNKLSVKQIQLIPSTTANHFHAIITLSKSMNTLERLIWQLHLGSDLYRGRADLMRYARGMNAPSLLITQWMIPNFRKHDYKCTCEKKHITEDQCNLGKNACPVWIMCRGLSPWELFGESSRETEMPIRLNVGVVPIELIMRKENG